MREDFIRHKVQRLLLFVDATRVVSDETGKLYFPGAFSCNLWKRYMELCEQLVVVCRKNHIHISSENATKQYNSKPDGNVEIYCVKDRFSSIQNYLSPAVKKYNNYLIEEEIGKADAVIVRTFSSMPIAHFYSLLKRYHKKVLVECVGCAWDAMWNHGIRGKILAPYSFFQARKNVRKANYVCYVTNDFLQKRYPTKGKQIAASDVDIPDTDAEVLEKRKARIRNHTGKYKIGTVAAVNVDYKGQKYVIQALSKLKKRGNCKFEYYCVGVGNSEKLKNLADRLRVSDCVIFPGALPHDDVIHFLDNLDIYIQPSLQEGLPRALIEAMSRGLPGFGSMTGGIPELLDKRCLFKKKHVKQIVRLLEALNKKVMLEQAERNFFMAKKYELQRNDRRLQEFYQEYMEACFVNN